MKKYLVLFFAPVAVIDAWKKTPAEDRKAAEQKMHGEWGQWMGKHGKNISDTAGAGKTKRVTAAGIADARNDVMLYSIVQAESHDAAAAMFEGHPHLQIPEGSIEIMEINALSAVDHPYGPGVLISRMGESAAFWGMSSPDRFVFSHVGTEEPHIHYVDAHQTLPIRLRGLRWRFS